MRVGVRTVSGVCHFLCLTLSAYTQSLTCHFHIILVTMETLPYDTDANFQFDSKAYLQRYTNPLEALGIQVQFLEGWHSFYQEHGKEFDPSESEMLEFGGGPALWSLISVAPCVKSITFSDYAETNRAEIQMWKNNDTGCHNWRPYIEYVVRTLEGNEDPSAVDVREQDIRRKIQSISFCDVRADKPLGNIEKKFDVIHTNLCLEIVCEDKEAFCGAFEKFHQYLKPRGYLLCLTALEGSWYLCWNGGDKKWHQLYLHSEDLDSAFERSGFTVLHTQVMYPASANLMSATKKWQFVVARKKN